MAACKHDCPMCDRTKPAEHHIKMVGKVQHFAVLPSCHPRSGESPAYDRGSPPSYEDHQVPPPKEIVILDEDRNPRENLSSAPAH